jgi:ABC-2 type transport system permease protein
MRLLSFELKKIVFSKKFLYLMLLIVLAISALFLRNVLFQSYIVKEESEAIQSQIKMSQANSRIHRLALERDPENEDAKKLQALNRPILDGWYELSSLVNSTKWENKLNRYNTIYTATIDYKDEGGEHPLSFKEINQMLALNERLLEEGIMPEHDTYSIALPNYMKHVLDLFTSLGAIIIMLLLIGESLSSEYENHSIKLLFTQPLKKTQIVVSKFWSSVILYFITVGIVLLTVTVIGLIFGKKGTFDYPILIEKNNAIEFLTVSEYMMQAMIVVSVTIVMLIALYLLYSVLFKHTISTLFVLVGTLVAGYALMASISWGPIAWLNPFQYLLPEQTILIQNDHVWYQGIPIILLLTAVFYFAALQKIKTSKSV